MFQLPPLLLFSARQCFVSDSTVSRCLQFAPVGKKGCLYRPPVLFAPTEGFQRFFEGKKVLVLCHGFKNSYENSVASFQKVRESAMKTGNLFDVVIGFTWPSKTNGLLLSSQFFKARQNIDAVSRQMAYLFDCLYSAGATVSVEGHSLGVETSLEAIKKMRGRIHTFFARAGAVPLRTFKRNGKYASSLNKCNSVHVTYSCGDLILKAYETRFSTKALGGCSTNRNLHPKVRRYNVTRTHTGHSDVWSKRPPSQRQVMRIPHQYHPAPVSYSPGGRSIQESYMSTY